jgi:hypothetical protein
MNNLDEFGITIISAIIVAIINIIIDSLTKNPKSSFDLLAFAIAINILACVICTYIYIYNPTDALLGLAIVSVLFSLYLFVRMNSVR